MEELKENIPVYLISADYGAKHKTVRLIFYDPKSQSLYRWYDKNHEPYCLTDLSPVELDKIPKLRKHGSLKRFEVIEKYDALRDENVWVTKIITKDPRAIGGGKPSESIREIIPTCWEGAKVWEARIQYGLCYTYDKELEMGMPYELHDGMLIPLFDADIEIAADVILKKVGIGKNGLRWVRLLEYPIPKFRSVALDVEVLGAGTTRVPDPKKGEYPVISACLIGSDGKRQVLLLLRKGVEVGKEVLPEGTTLQFFDQEIELIKTIFTEMMKYPFIITYNGDNFDLPYLYNRAVRLGMTAESIPIQLRRRKVKILGSIHIDLYRFFFKPCIRVYAFGGKYKNIKLDEIAQALLKKGKLHADKDIWLATEMRGWSYSQLAKYNCQDGDITLELTTFDDALVMRLMVILMRIGTSSMEDLVRSPISHWIRSMLFYEHRRRNYLIPNREDIIAVKGKTVTKAMIKGKSYKGAIVIEPVAGVHFNVTVVDFGSLYPSILKKRNLGYGTIRCPHPECKSNLIPETSHWVCTKNVAMEGEIIGLLRDLRVFHYKALGKKDSYYKVIEQAIKVFLNASYGVFGNTNFALYCPPVSESVTADGRHSIKQTIGKAKGLGIEVLYGDTDSVFLKDATSEQVETLSEWSTKTLGLDLGLDKTYRYVCLSSRKKNYMGVEPDGSLDIKGMTGKKKHIPFIIKSTFDVAKKYFAEAQTPKEVESLKKPLRKVVLQIYKRIKNRDFELEEMAFHMTLGKNPDAYDSTPQHAKAAKQLEVKGIFLKKGDIVDYVKVNVRAKGDPNVKPLELAEKEDIDVSKYHEMLKSTFEQLLDALEIDYSSIIGVTKLEQYL